MEEKDIVNPLVEFRKLSERINLLNNRFIAVAMDYKYYINDLITDNEIFKLRDNVMYKLTSASFHFQLLLEYHDRVEFELNERYKNNLSDFFENNIEFIAFERRAILEVYSIFDSMIYHLCSIFDYIFRIINYCHSQTIVQSPKWNLFKYDSNIKKNYPYCSKEMVEVMEQFDKCFVYPLIQHRSHLIHTSTDIGEFTLSINIKDTKCKAKFMSTDLFKTNFPEIVEVTADEKMTIKYSALWLIDKTITTTSELLFELSDDMKRNKRIPHGMFFTLGKNNEVLPPSIHYWGDRKIN
ncbi:hypothetical protein RT99_13905 [Flavobacterium sp. MEB061]|uniref:hypothetical protein n=1 Tax=Flavobacterium sp. MEB061 TaxID=1587524 RepID=UPI0005ABDC22|nr:hypothetical protein [Flavobacterium sp. MEB061]KIQ20169.1 hypothetical protein RT99_13905 [Flavobacterium sp. MEB061]